VSGADFYQEMIEYVAESDGCFGEVFEQGNLSERRNASGITKLSESKFNPYFALRAAINVGLSLD
jgi:hypothetical protein